MLQIELSACRKPMLAYNSETNRETKLIERRMETTHRASRLLMIDLSVEP